MGFTKRVNVRSTKKVVQGVNNIIAIETKLQAVNLCLSAMGRVGVPTLDTADIDASKASTEIDRVSYGLQLHGGEGWFFNKEPNWVLPVDHDGSLRMPNDVLSFVAYIRGKRQVGLTIRGNRLYDLASHSFDLRKRFKDGELSFTLVKLLVYEHLPPTAALAVAYEAAVTFLGTTEFEKESFMIMAQLAKTYRFALEKESVAQINNNYYEQNPNQNVIYSAVNAPSAYI